MDKVILSILIVLFCTHRADAQFLVEKPVCYPGVQTVKGKYYNGTGGGGYWSLSRLDAEGRIAETAHYRHKTLLSQAQFTYNSHNDMISYISTLNINNPGRIDTIALYTYRYDGERIIYQRNVNGRDSTVIRLIDNQADTLLVYEKKSYYFRPQTNTTDIYERRYTQEYRGGLLIRSEEFDLRRNSKEITRFKYYPNGMLKRRQITRVPEPERPPVYVGGPGSDDMSYRYRFDRAGRLKKLYYVVRGIPYKIATYKYDCP